MKKRDIIQLVKETIKEVDQFGNRQGPSGFSTSATAPAGKDPYTGKNEYPFSKRPKRTATGMMEDESTSFKVVDEDTGKTIDFGIDQAKAEEIVAAAKEDNINAKVVKMKNVDDVGKLKESQGSLSSDMLNYADQYHMELVDTMKGVSTHPDKRTDGFYIKFPHENGPGPGALFGKEVRLQIEKSKAAAKAAALKTYTKFQDQIEDYEIADSKSGVYGNVWLWIMPKTMDESPMFRTGIKQDMAPEGMAERIKYVFDKVNGTKHPVQTPEWHKNRFKDKYGISFPEDIKYINKDQAIAMNKYANDMKIKEATYAGKTAVDDMTKDPAYNALDGDAKIQLKKDLSQGGTATLEEDNESLLAEYMKERGDSNLMEHMDKHRKRVVLMEGAMKKFFEMFDMGKTDEEIVQDYAQRGTQVPEMFVNKARKQYEGLKKMKLELEMSEKEYKNSATQIVNNPATGEMDGSTTMETKQLATDLFNEEESINKK